jgi:THO complex subunit 4
MADLSLALDEIISTQRKGKPRGGGGGGRRVGGGGGGRSRPGPIRGNGGRGGSNFLRDEYFSNDVPAGKWKHDKFMDLYGGGGRRRGSGGAGRSFGGGRSTGGGRGGAMVHLNISNLPASVVTSDLEELFQDFKVFGVAVHYNETGEHLGTADLFVDAGSGKDIIREFTNIAIDGQEIKIALVDETAGKLSIRDRVERVARNPIYRRKAVGGSRRSMNGPRSRSGGRRSGGGGGGKAPSGGGGRRGPAAGGRTGAGGKKLVEMSAADLDKELEAYMGIRNSGKD